MLVFAWMFRTLTRRRKINRNSARMGGAFSVSPLVMPKYKPTNDHVADEGPVSVKADSAPPVPAAVPVPHERGAPPVRAAVQRRCAGRVPNFTCLPRPIKRRMDEKRVGVSRRMSFPSDCGDVMDTVSQGSDSDSGVDCFASLSSSEKKTG